jgi:hypothetical protein
VPKYKITHGTEFESLSRGELDDALGDLKGGMGHSYFQELARGVKSIRFLGVGTIAAGSLTISGPPGSADGLGGPEQGMTWAIRRLSADGLSANDVLKIYRSVVDAANFIGSITGPGFRAPFGSTEFILLPTDQIIVTGTGLTATGQIVVNGEGVEVPSFMISKLL